MPEVPPETDLRSRMIDATIALLADAGPAAIRVRSVAEATGVSTMAVYTHFGGIPELMTAVADRGFWNLAEAFEANARTADPVCDAMWLALTHRAQAQANPHLYDLMFGLSTRGSYRPVAGAAASGPLVSHSAAAFQAAYSPLVGMAERMASLGRVRDAAPRVVAAQLWSLTHGFVTLELTGHLAEFEDPVGTVLAQLAANVMVGLGDKPNRAVRSVARALAMRPKRRRSRAGPARSTVDSATR